MEVADFKPCPFCKESIRVKAVKCRFCGEWLDQALSPPSINPIVANTAPFAEVKTTQPAPAKAESVKSDVQSQVAPLDSQADLALGEEVFRDLSDASNIYPSQELWEKEFLKRKNTAVKMQPDILEKLWLDSDKLGRKPLNHQEVQFSGTFIEEQSANRRKVATLLYVVALFFFLFQSASPLLSAFNKSGADNNRGEAVIALVINIVIRFAGHAFLSPLGIICLAAYVFYYQKHKATKKSGTETDAKQTSTGLETVLAKNVIQTSEQTSDAKDRPIRPGLRIAATFLIVNAVLTFVITAFLQGGAANALTTDTLYRGMFFGDIICALALFSGRDGWRWYVIARIVYGVVYWVFLFPSKQGTAVDWLTSILQLLFLAGLLTLVLIKGVAKLQKIVGIAAVVIALASITSLNYVRYNQYQQTKVSLIKNMPWLTPEMVDLFLKDIATKRLNDTQALAYFTSMLERGNQQLTPDERKEVSQIYGIAFKTLPEDDATIFLNFAQKMRQQQTLTEAESDQMSELTIKALSNLKDPYKSRFQLLVTKEYEAAKSLP